MRIWLVSIVLGLATYQFEPNVGSCSDDGTDPLTESSSANQEESAMPFNLPLKTTGGTQVWTDHRFRDGFRVQQHALTGHWRLLDGADVRRGWGTREQCMKALDDACPIAVSEGPQHYVILLHGLMRTNHSMMPLQKSFNEAGYDNVVRFSYASTRSSMSDHAVALRELLKDLPSDATFSFVGHSMGNIVVRHLVGDLQRDGDPTGILPRCTSMVMLGPPNQGASIARSLAPTGLYGLITGKGGLELGPKWNEFSSRLATPPFPFVIVAGDVSEKAIQNPLVAGDGDFVVSLEEAELEGREAFHLVPVLHSFLMNDPASMNLCVDFIRSKDPASSTSAQPQR